MSITGVLNISDDVEGANMEEPIELSLDCCLNDPTMGAYLQIMREKEENGDQWELDDDMTITIHPKNNNGVVVADTKRSYTYKDVTFRYSGGFINIDTPHPFNDQGSDFWMSVITYHFPRIRPHNSRKKELFLHCIKRQYLSKGHWFNMGELPYSLAVIVLQFLDFEVTLPKEWNDRYSVHALLFKHMQALQNVPSFWPDLNTSDEQSIVPCDYCSHYMRPENISRSIAKFGFKKDDGDCSISDCYIDVTKQLCGVPCVTRCTDELIFTCSRCQSTFLKGQSFLNMEYKTDDGKSRCFGCQDRVVKIYYHTDNSRVSLGVVPVQFTEYSSMVIYLHDIIKQNPQLSFDVRRPNAGKFSLWCPWLKATRDSFELTYICIAVSGSFNVEGRYKDVDTVVKGIKFKPYWREHVVDLHYEVIPSEDNSLLCPFLAHNFNVGPHDNILKFQYKTTCRFASIMFERSQKQKEQMEPAKTQRESVEEDSVVEYAKEFAKRQKNKKRSLKGRLNDLEERMNEMQSDLKKIKNNLN